MDHRDNTLNRRHFLAMLGVTGTLSAMGLSGLTPHALEEHAALSPQLAATPQVSSVSPDEAVKRLLDGNARFISGKSTFPHIDAARRAEAAKGQSPFAAIISCSDSRVPPELIFDQGLGDVFVARTAGNIADDIVVGSVEYSVAVLGASVIMVLGHERCGAVVAAVEGKPLPGKIGELAKAIDPAVKATAGKDGDKVDLAVRENVRMTVEYLKTLDPIFAPAVKAGKLKIVGARYDLDDVKVEIIA